MPTAMNLNPEQLERAVRAFIAELPEGSKIKMMYLKPRVGFMDEDASYVTAVVVADATEDCLCFEQVVNAGLHHYATAAGLTDKVARDAEMAHQRVGGARQEPQANARKVIYLTDITPQPSSKERI